MELVNLSDIAERTGLPRIEVANFKYENGIRPVAGSPRYARSFEYDADDFAPLLRRSEA